MSARLLHLSDTHLLAGGQFHQGRVDTTAALEHVLESVAGIGALDAVVVSGDVSDDGSVESYEAAKGIVGKFAAARGAQVVWAMGNHDVRGPFARVLLGHEGAGDPDVPLDAVHEVDGLRIVVLDSSVPTRGHGQLRASQLVRLREVLRRPAARGSVVVVHHPPLSAPTVLHEALRLQNPADLMAALHGTDVRAVLSGHYHYPRVATLGGITVVVAPGVANRTDVLVTPGMERVLRGSGACLVEIGDDAAVDDGLGVEPVSVTLLASPVAGEGEELVVLDEQVVADIAGGYGVVPRAPAAS